MSTQLHLLVQCMILMCEDRLVETLQIEDLQGVTRKSPQDRAWARCHIAKVPAAARGGKSGVLSKVTQGFKHRLLVNKEVAQGDQIRRRMSQG
ncbi:hypothetical protein Tco_1008910 [Tanacetum coccineum]